MSLLAAREGSEQRGKGKGGDNSKKWSISAMCTAASIASQGEPGARSQGQGMLYVAADTE